MRVSFCLTTMDVFASCLVFFLDFLVFLAIELLNVPLIAIVCRVNPKVSDRWREGGGRVGEGGGEFARGIMRRRDCHLTFDATSARPRAKSNSASNVPALPGLPGVPGVLCAWPALTTPSTATWTPSAATATTTIKKTAQEMKWEANTLCHTLQAIETIFQQLVNLYHLITYKCAGHYA